MPETWEEQLDRLELMSTDEKWDLSPNDRAAIRGALDRLVKRGKWYPEMPPMLHGENADQYTDRLTGADKTDRQPYDHHRNRNCAIGHHLDCTDPRGERCRCPCHK